MQRTSVAWLSLSLPPPQQRLASLMTAMTRVAGSADYRRRRRRLPDAHTTLSDSSSDRNNRCRVDVVAGSGDGGEATTSALPFLAPALAQRARARHDALLATVSPCDVDDSVVVQSCLQRLLTRVLHAPPPDMHHCGCSSSSNDDNDSTDARADTSKSSNSPDIVPTAATVATMTTTSPPSVHTTALADNNDNDDDALRSYSPVLIDDVVARVARAADVPHALRTARRLCALLRGHDVVDDDDDSVAETATMHAVEVTRDTSSSSPAARVRDAVLLLQRTLHAWSRELATTTTMTTKQQQQLLQAGIATRQWLRTTPGRAPRLRACLLHSGDVQVSEVWHDGRVAALTMVLQPRTMAAAQHSQMLRVALCRMLHAAATSRRACTEASSRSNSSHHGSDACAVYLHMVLYKEAGVSLAEALRVVCATATAHWRSIAAHEQQDEQQDEQHDDATFVLGVDDVAVCAELDDRAVTTQVCSVRLRLPDAAATASAVHARTLTRASALVQALLHVNDASRRDDDGGCGVVLVQPLSWQWQPCVAYGATAASDGNNSSSSSSSNMAQYAVLLRGIAQPPHHLTAHAMRCAAMACVNYFAPHYFGAIDCPLRLYHVAAALSRDAYAEAIVMAATLAWWSLSSSSSSSSSLSSHDDGGDSEWLARLLALVCVETRQAVLREAWLRHVPARMQQRYDDARAALLWNVLASCRVRALACRSDGSGGAAVALSYAPLSSSAAAAVVTADAAPHVGDMVYNTTTTTTTTTTNSSIVSPQGDAAHDTDADTHASPLVTPPRHDSTRRHDALLSLSCGVCAITTLHSREQASAYTMRDVVLPLVHTPHTHASLDALAQQLGLVDVTNNNDNDSDGRRGGRAHRHDGLSPLLPLRQGHACASQHTGVRVRPLLVRPTGQPHTRHAWVRAFAEPVSNMADATPRRHQRPRNNNKNNDTLSDGDDGTTTCVYTLATDAALSWARQGGMTRNYAAASRGARRTPRALSRRGGHAMADRLPLGLLAAAAAAAATSSSSSTASLHGSHLSGGVTAVRNGGGGARGGVEGARGSACLALHYTLPAECDGYAWLQCVCGVVHDGRTAAMQQHRRAAAAAAASSHHRSRDDDDDSTAVSRAHSGSNAGDGDADDAGDDATASVGIDGDVMHLPRPRWRDAR